MNQCDGCARKLPIRPSYSGPVHVDPIDSLPIMACTADRYAAPSADQRAAHCEWCDPSFSCFNGSEPCSKKPLPADEVAEMVRRLETAAKYCRSKGFTPDADLMDEAARLLARSQNARAEALLLLAEMTIATKAQRQRAEQAEAALAGMRDYLIALRDSGQAPSKATQLFIDRADALLGKP